MKLGGSLCSLEEGRRNFKEEKPLSLLMTRDGERNQGDKERKRKKKDGMKTEGDGARGRG